MHLFGVGDVVWVRYGKRGFGDLMLRTSDLRAFWTSLFVSL